MKNIDKFNIKKQQCFYNTNDTILKHNFDIMISGAKFQFAYSDGKPTDSIVYACYITKNNGDFFIDWSTDKSILASSVTTEIVASALQHIVDLYNQTNKYRSLDNYWDDVRKLSYYNDFSYDYWQEEYDDLMIKNMQIKSLFSDDEINALMSFIPMNSSD